MITARSSQPSQQANFADQSEIKISKYDRAAGLLIALLVLVGLVVALLVLIWLTRAVSFPTRVPSIEPVGMRGTSERDEQSARDFESPGTEEISQMGPELSLSLEKVTEAASLVAASSANDVLDTEGGPIGSKRGPHNNRSFADFDLDVVPEWQRLEARLASRSMSDYVDQLDYFAIELGALNRESPQINYARNFTKAIPDTRSGTRDDENEARRLYFIHQQGVLKDWDRSLLERAGIATKGRILAQFYPPGLRDQLLQLEHAARGSRSLAEVQKTVFAVQREGADYRFFVAEQTYRPAPR